MDSRLVAKGSSESAVLRAVSDPIRRSILELLAGRSLSVREIADRFPISRPAISKHLRVLREAGLVVERRLGRKRLNRLDARPLEQAAARLAQLWVHLQGQDHEGGERNEDSASPQALPTLPARHSRPRLDDWRCW